MSATQTTRTTRDKIAEMLCTATPEQAATVLTLVTFLEGVLAVEPIDDEDSNLDALIETVYVPLVEKYVAGLTGSATDGNAGDRDIPDASSRLAAARMRLHAWKAAEEAWRPPAWLTKMVAIITTSFRALARVIVASVKLAIETEYPRYSNTQAP